MIRVAPRPEGHPTRGFTAPNPLRLVDTYVLVAHREQLGRASLFVDLGYGSEPVTTAESFDRFRRVRPLSRALGIEIEPERVVAAQPFQREGLEFRLGGFNLPLEAGDEPGVIRAFNVLRQYPETSVNDALWSVSRSMPPGALLIEGTSDPYGRHVCFWVWERDGSAMPLHVRRGELPLQRKWLVFGARLHEAFSPRDIQPFLPKELIHHAEPGGALDSLFASWERAWDAAAGRVPRDRWLAASEALHGAGHQIDRRRGLLRRSLLAFNARRLPVLAGGHTPSPP